LGTTVVNRSIQNKGCNWSSLFK